MKYLCVNTCQVRLLPSPSKPKGQILMVKRGEVVDSENFHKDTAFADSPSVWSCLDDPKYKVDFSTATDEELLEAQWDFNDASAFVKENYNATLKKGSKKDVVDQIVDAKYRHIKSPVKPK